MKKSGMNLGSWSSSFWAQPSMPSACSLKCVSPGFLSHTPLDSGSLWLWQWPPQGLPQPWLFLGHEAHTCSSTPGLWPPSSWQVGLGCSGLSSGLHGCLNKVVLTPVAHGRPQAVRDMGWGWLQAALCPVTPRRAGPWSDGALCPCWKAVVLRPQGRPC